jgi:MFS family permease
MIDRLHASLDDVLWVLNAYALVLAVLVITAGRLRDLLGPRTMFAAGITVFTAASAACGFAPRPGLADRLPRGPGLGRGHADAADAGHRHYDVPAGTARGRVRHLGVVAGLATIADPTLGALLVTAFD